MDCQMNDKDNAVVSAILFPTPSSCAGREECGAAAIEIAILPRHRDSSRSWDRHMQTILSCQTQTPLVVTLWLGEFGG